MKAFRSLVMAVSMVALSASASAQTPDVEGAKAAASSWLQLADRGDFAATYAQFAPLSKGMLTEAQWVQAAGSVRGPLGAVKSRAVRSATATRTLPGVPDGEYVVIQYDTEFANKARAVETVTPVKGEDGVWRVTGYFVN